MSDEVRRRALAAEVGEVRSGDLGLTMPPLRLGERKRRSLNFDNKPPDPAPRDADDVGLGGDLRIDAEGETAGLRPPNSADANSGVTAEL